MNSQNIIDLKKDILLSLSKRQIKNAIELILKLAVNVQNWQISEKLNELDSNYKYMLHYLFEGVEDQQRDSVYNNLLRTLYEITDDVTNELLKAQSSNLFFERQRIADLKQRISLDNLHSQLRNNSDSALDVLLEEGEAAKIRQRDLAVQKERIETELFNSTFISARASDSDYNSSVNMIDSIDISSRSKSLFVSAITLNILHCFDAKKTQILIYASKSNDLLVRSRALVGLVIVMQMYDNRWHLYPELCNMLDTLKEDPSFKRSVVNIVIQLIRSRETEKITKKLTEEIIPEMMRFNNLAGKKLNIEELMGGDADFMEKNPEWKKEFDESGLADKLQEYSNLQMEGADVFHSTFSNLKNFSFFAEMSNWFLPFDTSYSELRSIFPETNKNNILNTAIVDSHHMCDSDKYSFAFSLLQIPTAQREMIMNRMSAESEEIKKLRNDSKDINPNIEEEILTNQYIQNLYRFFKLYSSRSNFFDIFRLRLNFYDKKSIAPIISDSTDMHKIARFFFDKNNFKEATDVYSRLVEDNLNDSDIWQKVGYCYQMLDRHEMALDAYHKADDLSPNNPWLVRRLAQLYRSLKMPDKSLEYYKKALLLTPDNLNIELNIGHCYLELKEYEKALNSYFKVEVLDSENGKALRPIAWTAFLLHRYDLSRNYYKQILANKPTVHDYLNAGHADLCLGEIKDAINHYKEAVMSEQSFDSFRHLFITDIEYLNERGIDSEMYPFILDQLQYITD